MEMMTMAKVPKKALSKTSSKAPTRPKAKAKAAKPAAKTTQPAPAAPRGGIDELSSGFANLRKDMDRIFEEMSSDFGLFPHRWRLPSFRAFPKLESIALPATPRVDVNETDQAITVTAELPGMEEKDVDVTVGDGYISISGEKKSESEKKEKGGYLQERSYGSFHRSFRLPDSVDVGKISADLKKGVLTVTLPKKAEATANKRKVSVKSA
jgi:HSP20 family protein